VKSPCGGPRTASIPKTRDPPEETNSKRFRPCGNSASTGISPFQPIHQRTRGLTNDKQHTPHLDAGTTTASARTKQPVSVRAGQPHPAANPRQAAAQGAAVRPDAVMGRSHCSRLPNRALPGSRAAFGGLAARVLAPLRAAPLLSPNMHTTNTPVNGVGDVAGIWWTPLKDCA
jgi:hypothetical protein